MRFIRTRMPSIGRRKSVNFQAHRALVYAHLGWYYVMKPKKFPPLWAVKHYDCDRESRLYRKNRLLRPHKTLQKLRKW